MSSQQQNSVVDQQHTPVKTAINNQKQSETNSKSVSRLRDQIMEQSRQQNNHSSLGTRQNRSNSSSHAIVNALGGASGLRYQTGNIDNLIANSSNKCTHEDCPRAVCKANLCKHHYCMNIKNVLRRELRNIYRGPDKAYASMDFYGRGYITEEDFLNSIVVTRIPFSKQDVQEFFRQFNMFNMKMTSGNQSHQTSQNGNNKNESSANKQTVGGLNFDQFKKMFFPQLFLINEEQDSDEDRKQKKNQLDLSGKKQSRDSKSSQPESVITDRLKKLEKILKDKFQNQWESVRKAFLALDTDYDGYITVEDILRYFGQEKDLNYNDLKKLIRDKDSKKIGKIGYTDFSKWVGNSIHQSEGFYFRHDSIKNPQFEANNERNEVNQNNLSKKKAQECLINQNLEKTVLDKIQFQWKTLRKAFMDLNMEKSGSIMPDELRFYFKHWGLNLADDQFRYLFDKFDLDGDGKISYKDFQLTVGSEIHPAEGLYFRQDKPQTIKINSCKHEKCWQATQGSQSYCSLHLKLHQDECSQLFGKFFAQLKTKWPKFIEMVRKASDQDDKNQIFFDDLISVLKKFKIVLTNKEQAMILDSFPGRDEGDRKRINVSKLYDHKYNMMLQKIYQKVDVHENDGDDDPVDQSGYTGQFYRQKKNLIVISEQELVQVIARNNKLVDIIRTIKEIDKQHNGFVTTTELDDILKIQYKEELGDRDLRQIMKKYASIQNRVLVDYKKFRDSIIQQIKLVNSNFTFPDKTESMISSPEKNNNNNTIIQPTLKPNFSTIIPNQRAKSLEKSSTLNTTMLRYESSKNEVTNKQSLGNNNNNEDQGLVMIRELINRPQTRQYVKYSSTRGDLIPQKKQYLKNDLLNQTMSLNKNASLLSSNELHDKNLKFQTISKTPGQGASRLQLKKLSTTLDQTNMFQDSINDYSDFHIKNDSLMTIDNKLIQDNLKRAQSSHGIFGRNGGSVSMQAKNSNSNAKSYAGINNLLQNLRQQRRNIQGTNGVGRDNSLSQDNYATLDNYLSKAINSNNSDAILAFSKPTAANTINNTISASDHKNNTMKNSQINLDYNLINNSSFDIQNAHNLLSKDKININYTSLASKKKSEALNLTTQNQQLQQNNNNNNLSQTMYQTLNASTMSNSHYTNNKIKNVLKNKLSYEWKNIYRHLSQQDKSINGQITVQDFETALDQFHVFMTKEELKKVQQLYGQTTTTTSNPNQNSNSLINYQQLSMDLGLHNNQLSFLKNSSIRMQNIQKLRNIYSSSEKKNRLDEISSAAGLTQGFLQARSRQRNMNNSIIDRINTAAVGGRSHLAMRLNTQSSLSGTHKNLDNIKVNINNNNNNISIQNQNNTSEVSTKQEVKDTLLKKIKDFRDLIHVYQKKNHCEEAIIPMGDFKTVLKQLGINLPNNALQQFVVESEVENNNNKNGRSKSANGFYGNVGNAVTSGVDAREFLKFYI